MSSRKEYYAQILFSDAESKSYLSSFFPDANDFDMALTSLIKLEDDISSQKILAPILRNLAVTHLRNGQSEFACNFRKQYAASLADLDDVEAGDHINLTHFLDDRQRAYVYGSELEGCALADLLGMTFCTTGVDELGNANTPLIVHYIYPDSKAPIVNLFNRPGNHFFILESQYNSTFGDGNCLYNGFAQIILQDMRLNFFHKIEERLTPTPSVQKVPTTPLQVYEQNAMNYNDMDLNDDGLVLKKPQVNAQNFIDDSLFQDIINHQQELFNQIKGKHSKPVAEVIKDSLEFINTHEYQLALKIAKQVYDKSLDSESHTPTPSAKKSSCDEPEQFITFDNELTLLLDKAKNNKEQRIIKLVTELRNKYNLLKQNSITMDLFKQQSLSCIAECETTLTNQCNWIALLKNLAAIILGLGIPLICNYLKNNYVFFKSNYSDAELVHCRRLINVF